MNYFKTANIDFVNKTELNTRAIAYKRGARKELKTMARRYARHQLKADLKKEVA